VSTTTKNIASVVFVLVLGLFLSQPILNASSDGPPAGGEDEPASTTTTVAEEPTTTTEAEAATTTTAVEDEPTPEPSASEDEGAAPTELLTALPPRCLKGVAKPVPGLIAGLAGGTVSIAPPGGAVTASFPAKAPIAWSASGRFLATGGGTVFTSEGQKKGSMFTAAAASWAWSPVADCAVGLVRGGLQFGMPNGEYGALLYQPVTDFAFSPNGQKLALAMDDPSVPGVSVWEANLKTGALSQLDVIVEAESVTLLGWATPVVPIYAFSEADRVAVHFATEELAVKGRVFKDGLVPCGPLPGLIARFPGSSGPRFIHVQSPTGPQKTSPSERIAGAACAGAFIVAAGSPPDDTTGSQRLFLLDRNGGFVQDLTDGIGYDDHAPVWGPKGTGVAFLRKPTAGGDAQIWYIAEGGRAAYSGMAVASPKSRAGHIAWQRVFDWSAERPSGTPADK
jgi:hypothetical protein